MRGAPWHRAGLRRFSHRARAEMRGDVTDLLRHSSFDYFLSSYQGRTPIPDAVTVATRDLRAPDACTKPSA